MKNKIISWLLWPIRSLSVSTIIAMLLVPAVVHAGDHWLSRVTVTAPTQFDTIISENQVASENLDSTITSNSTVVFDITISL